MIVLVLKKGAGGPVCPRLPLFVPESEPVSKSHSKVEPLWSSPNISKEKTEKTSNRAVLGDFCAVWRWPGGGKRQLDLGEICLVMNDWWGTLG